MSTTLTVRINYVDSTVTYQTTPADYIALSLDDDYIIWSDGSDDVTDLMTHAPTEDELNEASVVIDEDDDKEPTLCLLYDDSHDVGGAYYTHQIKGISENKRYVFAFSFSADTASEPVLEAWDSTDRNSTAKHVLGAGTPADSWVKAVCTTAGLPGVSWAGTPLAGSGATYKLKLNNDAGALGDVPSGQTTQELYANIKIVVPQAYTTPAVESFVLSVRYTWN